MHLRNILLALSCMLVLRNAVAGADEDPETHVWTITDGLKGSPSQLQHMLNASVEDAWSRLTDDRQALQAKQDQIAAESGVIIKSVHETQAYKDDLAQATRVEAELEDARKNQNISAAMGFGSQANLAKQAMKKLEDSALRNDPHLAQAKDFAADYTRKISAAEASFKKTANWRSRIVHSVRFGTTLTWPVSDGQTCCFNSGKIIAIKDGQLQFASEADELIPGTQQQNARGDGIGIATFHIHSILVSIPIPPGIATKVGSTLPIKGVYKITGSPDLSGDLPIYRAEPDPNGGLGVLLHHLNTVVGPPQPLLDKIDDDVDASEARALEEMNRKGF